MKKSVLILLLIVFLFTACSKEKNGDEKSEVLSSIVTDFTETSSIGKSTTKPEESFFETEKTSQEAESVKISFPETEEIKNGEKINIILEFVSAENVLKVYEKTDGNWCEVLKTVACCGRNGVSKNKKEGDLCTPSGFYRLGTAFGINDAPDGVKKYLKVTDSMYWVDDPDSKYYNRLFDTSENDDKDWRSAEHLIDYKIAYAYGMVIEYNTNPVSPGKGSAIFLHCGQNKTYGCISVPEEIMIQILKLTSGKCAYILIR